MLVRSVRSGFPDIYSAYISFLQRQFEPKRSLFSPCDNLLFPRLNHVLTHSGSFLKEIGPKQP